VVLTGPTIAADEIIGSPAWFPLETMEGEAVRLIQLDEAAYRAASFLDQRLLGAGYRQSACGLAVLSGAAGRLAAPSHYIFHIGHVGSTLISRLLGAHQSFFALREPALLRAVSVRPAPDAGAPSLGVVLALLGRTWRKDQRAVIKVTSFVSELAELMLAADHRPVAIFMFAHPRAYLRGIFAGPNSLAETRQLAPSRLQRLLRRLGEGDWRPDPRSQGECVAMSWLCEMTVLHQAADRFESQVLWVNFDTFLAEPFSGLQAIFQALGERPAPSEIESLVTGPLMRQYSKAPEHAYDAALRRTVLLSAEREHGPEIRRGMLWLQQAAARRPLIQTVLRLAQA
jgi:hypothetical protein